MDVVSGVIDILIPKLEKLLGEEYELQKRMKNKVRFLTRELHSIRAFLHKVSDVPWYQLDEQIKIWAHEAREASFDMEDILDKFHMHFDSLDPVNQSRLKRTMNNMTRLFSKAKARRHISCAIQDIKDRLQEVADRRARYRIDDIVVHPASGTTSTVDPRLQAMYKEVASLVGINKPRDDIISMLSSKAEDVALKKKIVAIAGLGGLGKTTLAKAVYEKISVDFNCSAFVPVGRNPNLSRLLMDILYDLDKKTFEDIHTKNRDVRQLIGNLREFLTDKRYFIVVDDLWEEESWIQAIHWVMLENNCGSRIIITTRNFEVAKNISDEVYKMAPLSEDNSKRLLYKRIFGDEKKWPDNEPDEISKKILKKCDGVPLAIITMASLLVAKPRDRWSDVFTSIGIGHKGDKQVDNTMKILSFSYYDMPAHLRTCLLYLSFFPEDYKIDKTSLIWRWIAEGFVQGKQRIRLFQQGEQYFNHLVNRSMIQAIESGVNGAVEGCRVHDMVLDLIRSISSEENFITILDSDGNTVSPSLRTARRIVLHNNTIEHIAYGNMVEMEQVRSFAAVRCPLRNWIQYSNCELLRVLDLEACNDVTPPDLVHLGKLHHLRYLGLRDCEKIDDIPNEIGGLKFLEILNLEGGGVMHLRSCFSRLNKLTCLKGTYAPNWIGMLASLEELDVRTYSSYRWERYHREVYNGSLEGHNMEFFKGLGSLNELRALCCEVTELYESMQQVLVPSLRNLCKLQILNLTNLDEFYDGQEADTALWGEDFLLPRHLQVLRLEPFKFPCLPPCIGAVHLPNLTSLSLHVVHMDPKDLESLGSLPELYYLRLNTKSAVTISNIGAGNGYFRKLRFFDAFGLIIQFQCKEEDPGVSFHIWNESDEFNVQFSCSKTDYRLAPYSMMSNLEDLMCHIPMRALIDSNFECGNFIGLEYLPSLRSLDFSINCSGEFALHEDDAVAVLRKAAKAHPNSPYVSGHISY